LFLLHVVILPKELPYKNHVQEKTQHPFLNGIQYQNVEEYLRNL